ncbi:MAG: hypothetical protein AAF675_17185 [Pseudomonadota bacterium]
MNMTPDSEQFVTTTKTARVNRPAWIDANFAVAEAHNAKRGLAWTGAKLAMGHMVEGYKEESKKTSYRVMLGGSYLVFWGTAALFGIAILV